jgi:hypothetical protein
MDASDAWTTAHDLAIVYIALAYGTDHHLSDSELRVLTEPFRRGRIKRTRRTPPFGRSS